MNDSGRQKRQNVIWIFGDQHRGQALSCHGDPNLSTPNIDRMAMTGVDFPAAVAGFPLCCPFRGSLLTGIYPHKCIPGHQYPMPEGQETIAHVFRNNGYHTAYFGKWHCDGWNEADGRAAMHLIPPQRRGGFGTWIGYENNNSQWDCWVHGHEADGREVPHTRLAQYETDALSDLLIDYITGRSKAAKNAETEPFFAVLSVQPPHDPYIAPERWGRRHRAAALQLRQNVPPVDRIAEEARRYLGGYYAQIENLDWNIGRVRDALADAGLLDNTHIIFFSDHGDMMGSHGQFKKVSPWEESLRIPFIIGGLRDKYVARNGLVSDALVNHVDIAPTTLGLCGITPPDWMEGTDYSGIRRPGANVSGGLPDSAYIQSVVPTGHGDSVNRPWRGVVTRDGWKYVAFEETPFLMFNLNEDPFELANMAHNNRYRQERRRLNELLAAWVRDTDDSFRLPEV